MARFTQRDRVASTPFSDFIRNASSETKKRVYARVLKKASERQRTLLRETQGPDARE